MEADPIKKPSKKKTPVESAEGVAPTPAPSLKLYRRIALSFVVITFLALAAVAYLSFSEATVRITPEAQAASTEFAVDVVEAASLENEISGQVVGNVFAQAGEQGLSGEGTKQIEGKSGGMVTIVNTYSANQPLVATTRLLSPEGILFRIDTTVTVPSGGSVQVMAHADQPGVAGDIGPTRFTIPGLSTTLQESIYAESSEPMTGGVRYVKVVSEEDLDAAALALEEQMFEAAKTTLRLEAGGAYSGEVFVKEVVERQTDTPPGTETDTVMVALKLRVVGVFFQQPDLLTMAEAKLQDKIPEGMEFIGLDETSLQLTVERSDLEAQIASVSVALSGTATLSPDSDLLDKESFLGKSPAEVKAALEASEAIKTVAITFTPFWLQRMPTLKDHIKIIIE